MNLKDKFKKSKIENEDASRARSAEKIKPPKKSTQPDNQPTLNISRAKELRILLEDHGARGKALAALMEALNATIGRYEPKTKTMWQEPDHRVRASAAVDILCFTDGKPVERREQVNINIDGNDEAQRKIIESPALRAAIAAKIQEAEAAQAQAAVAIKESNEQNKGNS